MQQLSWGIEVHAHISNKNFHMHCKLYLRVLNQRKVKLWFLILNVSASSRQIYSLEEIEKKCSLSNSLANKTIYMSSLSIFNLLSAFDLEKISWYIFEFFILNDVLCQVLLKPNDPGEKFKTFSIKIYYLTIIYPRKSAWQFFLLTRMICAN